MVRTHEKANEPRRYQGEQDGEREENRCFNEHEIELAQTSEREVNRLLLVVDHGPSMKLSEEKERIGETDGRQKKQGCPFAHSVGAEQA